MTGVVPNASIFSPVTSQHWRHTLAESASRVRIATATRSAAPCGTFCRDCIQLFATGLSYLWSLTIISDAFPPLAIAVVRSILRPSAATDARSQIEGLSPFPCSAPGFNKRFSAQIVWDAAEAATTNARTRAMAVGWNMDRSPFLGSDGIRHTPLRRRARG